MRAALCAVALIAGAASTVPRAAWAAERPATRILTCSQEGAYRPRSIILACADANASLSDLRWSSWSDTRATASGVYTENDCKPFCAAGRFHDYPVAVAFDRPLRTKSGFFFDRVVLTFPRGKPPGHRSWTLDELLPHSLRRPTHG